MTEDSARDSEDAAWVTIETPFDATTLRAFLDDVERLYRINPYLVFEEWRQTGAHQYLLRAKNLSNGKMLETGLEVEGVEGGIRVRYSAGLRTATTFRIEARADGTAQLIVLDDYSGTSAAERESRLDEVDKSLAQWGVSLRRYLRQWRRWSWLPGWKFYMRRVWQPMKPMARRIVFILTMVTVAEFVVFLFVFSIFWLEQDR